MRYAAIVFAVVLSGCATADRTPEERLLIACEAWLSVFERINTRDRLDLATDAEVDAVNDAISVINPVCEAGPSGNVFNITSIEDALIAVIAAGREG